MNRELAREIIGCLGVAGAQDASVRRLRRFPWREWRRALGWLDHSGLALPFWHRLKDRGEEDSVPPVLACELQRNLESHRQRAAAMAEEFRSINRLFERAGFAYAALKGFALIPEYCPLASLRTSYDYDYLVPSGDLDRAEGLLEQAGYIPKKESVEHPRVYFREAAPPWTPSERDDLYSANFPRTIELHDRLWDPDELSIALPLPRNPFDRIERRSLKRTQLDFNNASELESLCFWALSEEDELIFQALHAFRHILQNWCRLCSLLDVAWFLEHRFEDAGFWKRFVSRVGTARPLGEVIGVVFALSARLFGASVPDCVVAQTTATMRPAVMLWAARYGEELALSNFSGTKYSLFLHREFIESDSVWNDLARRALLPLHRPNEAATASSRQASARAAAAWNQGLYFARRLGHHALAAVRYGLEKRRWERLKSSESARSDETSGATRFGLTSALSLLYLLLALACLMQWGTPRLWARVDWLCGSYLALRAFGAAHSLLSAREAFHSKRTRREWWGLTSNPSARRWAVLLMFGDLAAFLDYGHWRLMPAFDRPDWRALGLALYVLAAAGQMWTDAALARYFAASPDGSKPMSTGPFRYVRHPRYATAIAAKAALALALASLAGWVLWLGWTVVLLRTVRAEESHLWNRFGLPYERYAARTARLLPGIY